MTVQNTHALLNRLQGDAHALHQGANSGAGFQRARSKATYGVPKVGGTRPSSGGGVTFHMKHAFITKGRHVSNSLDSYTPASKHQGYIERPGAVDRIEGWEVPKAFLDRTPGEPPLELGDPPRLPLPEGTQWPETEATPGRMSFGNLGSTKAERTAFWRTVEDEEGKKGRVQCRVILELPHEVQPTTRLHIARDFCRTFENHGLPYWASIHAPYGRNDPRNYHLHVAYHDRPARKLPEGVWDFTAKVVEVSANRARHTRRPWKLDKDRECQGPKWIRQLRTHYAEVANFHLAADGVDKRYDPRPYSESGVNKEPTRHLGTRASVAEAHGVATRAGQENSRKETTYRLGYAEETVQEALLWHEAIRTQRRGRRAIPGGIDDHLTDYADAWASWKQATERAEAHRLAEEAATLRLRERMEFLEEEGGRLLRRPKDGQETAASEAAERLWQEHRMASSTLDQVGVFAAACAAVAAQAEADAVRHREAADASRQAIEARMQAVPAREIDPMAKALEALVGPDVRRREAEVEPAQNLDLERIQEMSNVQLRRQAGHLRGTIQVADSPEMVIQQRAEYAVYARVAEDRGLNLHTGEQRLDRAKDPVQARGHTDVATEPFEQQRLIARQAMEARRQEVERGRRASEADLER